MSYTPMYELWRTSVGDAVFEILLDLGHGEDFPLKTHPWFFGVRIPMTNHNSDGLPSDEEAERLNAVENRVREVAKSRDGLFVGRRQGRGARDLLFYFPTRPTGLDDRIRVSMGTELLFISRDDRRWAGYEALLPGPREWRRIEDSRIIADLIQRDADPKAPHVLFHRVSTTINKGAEALVALMEKLELVDIQIAGEKPELTVVGIQKTPLDPDAIVRVSFVLESKAEKARGRYLGWSADPVSAIEGGERTPDPLDFDDDDDLGLDFDDDDDDDDA